MTKETVKVQCVEHGCTKLVEGRPDAKIICTRCYEARAAQRKTDEKFAGLAETARLAERNKKREAAEQRYLARMRDKENNSE